MGPITGNIVFKLLKLNGMSLGSFNQSDNEDLYHHNYLDNLRKRNQLLLSLMFYVYQILKNFFNLIGQIIWLCFQIKEKRMGRKGTKTKREPHKDHFWTQVQYKGNCIELPRSSWSFLWKHPSAKGKVRSPWELSEC